MLIYWVLSYYLYMLMMSLKRVLWIYYPLQMTPLLATHPLMLANCIMTQIRLLKNWISGSVQTSCAKISQKQSVLYLDLPHDILILLTDRFILMENQSLELEIMKMRNLLSFWVFTWMKPYHLNNTSRKYARRYHDPTILLTKSKIFCRDTTCLPCTHQLYKVT